MKIIKQGAEAILYIDKENMVKERIKKNYRLTEIDDKLRRFRTKRESRLLDKANMIKVPKVLNVDEENFKITMEFIEGQLLKDCLDIFNKNKRIKICTTIGREIGKLHDCSVIHGDLTTSNMILKNDEVYFIDFGLGFISNKIEDKAVDLHLLKQAFESKHYKTAEVDFNAVLEGYKKSKDYKKVVERLKKVEERGRYKRKK